MVSTQITLELPTVHVSLVNERFAEKIDRVAFHWCDLVTVPQQGDRLWTARGTECWEVVRREFAADEPKGAGYITVVVRRLDR